MFNDQEIANVNRALDSLKNNQIFVPEGLDKPEEKPKEEEDKGFFGKLLILQDTFKAHHWLGLFGLLSSIFGAFVYLRLLLIFFKKLYNFI